MPDTAATVADLQYKLRRTYIIAGTVLITVTVAAVVFLDATGHFNDLRAFAGVLSPAVSTAVLLFTQYRTGKANITSQGQVLHQTNGMLSDNIGRAVSKVASSPEFQELAAQKIAEKITVKLIGQENPNQ